MARRLGIPPWDMEAAMRDPAKTRVLLAEEAVMEFEAAMKRGGRLS
jgi:hypothetical protein